MKTVNTAQTTTTTSAFHNEIMAQVTSVESASTEGKRAVMGRMAKQYGKDALREAKFGGFSGNAVRNRTPEQYKAEGSRLNLTEGAARELHGIILAINAIRPNCWQEYQRTMFPRESATPAKAVTKEHSPELVAAIAERDRLAGESNAIKARSKLTEAKLLLADTDEEKETLRATLDSQRNEATAAREALKLADEKVKQTKADDAAMNEWVNFAQSLEALATKYKDSKDKHVKALAKKVLKLVQVTDDE